MTKSLMFVRTITLAVAVLWGSGAAIAASEKVLHNFTGRIDGAAPWAPVVFDAAGTLYGTTQLGGLGCSYVDGCGTVYALKPTGHITTLHAFTDGTDGVSTVTGLTLVGTTLFGGTQGGSGGSGVLFSIGVDGSDFTVLHSFVGTDGLQPVGLLRSSGSALYGLTLQGGIDYNPAIINSLGYGVLFRLQRNGEFQILHSFTGRADGRSPNAIVMDAAGNLFGSASGTNSADTGCNGIHHGCGVVFEYVPATGAFTILHSFTDGTDGTEPVLGSIGPDGSLYGTTAASDTFKHGSLFALTPSSEGYALATLAAFALHSQGDGPVQGPTLAPNGALIGATSETLYEFSNGSLNTLLTFGAKGGNPLAQPVIGPGSAIYGTTEAGGTATCKVSLYGCGVVYKYPGS